jgi:NAD-dependent SIR2 family protein deacetylase
MAYSKEKDKLIIKFNGGIGAVLCSNCHVIVENGFGNNYNKDIPIFCCNKCKEEWFKTENM